uniref:4'-phosphopantetheinyl transferase domain-containing protein n=1 Tax=Peronospora matthiolae TaxID=2874970 RepID=A0AAV1TF78_9STRA
MARTVYGIGVDVALIARFERSYARFGKRLLTRAFHPIEISEFYARAGTDRATYLASRWALKEATFKAFQRYRVQFPDIYAVQRGLDSCAAVPTALPVTEKSKALRIEFAGETKGLAKQLRLVEPLVSISHDGNYAVAYVLLQQEVDEVMGEGHPRLLEDGGAQQPPGTT